MPEPPRATRRPGARGISAFIHLLGFAMLYGMTGLVFAFSSYPGWLRGVLTPLALVAQVVDVSFWWLGRLSPKFARGTILCALFLMAAALLLAGLLPAVFSGLLLLMVCGAPFLIVALALVVAFAVGSSPPGEADPSRRG